MTKIIEQEEFNNIQTYDEGSGHLGIWQSDRFIMIEKQGAKQLIEVLKEWVGENN